MSFISFYSALKSRQSSAAGPRPSFVCPNPALEARGVIPAGCPVSCFALLQGQAEAIHHGASRMGTHQSSKDVLGMLQFKS